MAFTTGSATHHNDLLDKLRLYLVAQGWTVDDYTAGATPTDVAFLAVTGPGSLGGEQPKVSIQTAFNTGTNAYAWAVGAYPQYDDALPFGLQVLNSPLAYLLLWNGTIDYWFYVNDRRFIVVAKIGTHYMSLYAGFFLPFALPDEYRFPYYVGASHVSLQPYNLNNAGVRSFADPGRGAAYYMRRAGADWGGFANAENTFNVLDAFAGQSGPVVWPYRGFSAEGRFESTTDIAWSFLQRMRPLANGRMPMWQCTIMDSTDRAVQGILDGVFATSGFGRVPEQLVTVGADDYRLFISASKDTPKHYFAVEEA